MTDSKIFLVRSILGMCAISFFVIGCKKDPAASRGGSTQPETLGTEQSAGNENSEGSGAPAPSEAVPNVPDPAEIVPHVPDPAEIE